ncbi:MAG: glycosyl hydrolase family 25, partial [Bacteroidales bacterium]|nr:glycosyl hydrolase family 25 [Bacteroidales bacterium]
QKPTINGGGTYTIWQYTDKGTVRGIPHNVDLGRFNSKHSVASITLKTAKK